MKRVLLAGLLCLISVDALAGGERGEAIIGGALGGAAGAVIGQQVGGATGAAIGGAVGGALGAGLAVDDHHHAQPAYGVGYPQYGAPVGYYPRYARPVIVPQPVAYYPAYARPVVVQQYYRTPVRPVFVNIDDDRHHGRGWGRHHDRD